MTPESDLALSAAGISGRLIAARRKEIGLSQVALAEQMHVGQSTVADWERGKTRPRPALWPMLAAVLKIDLAKIFPDMAHKLPGDEMPDIDLERQHLEKVFLYLYDNLYEYKRGIGAIFHSIVAGLRASHDGPPDAERESDRHLALVTFSLWLDIMNSEGKQAPAEEARAIIKGVRAIVGRMQKGSLRGAQPEEPAPRPRRNVKSG